MCNDCIHKGVCVHRESCESLQASTKCYQLEEIFRIEIVCKHHLPEIRYQYSALNSYQMP